MIGRAMETKHSLTDELQVMLEQSEARREASTRAGVPPSKDLPTDETTGLHRVTPPSLHACKHAAPPGPRLPGPESCPPSAPRPRATRASPST
jgi:hypothetical protein